MKASELIEFLQEQMIKHGDHEVLVRDDQERKFKPNGVSFNHREHLTFKIRSEEKTVFKRGWFEIS